MSRRRLYEVYNDYLKACAHHQQEAWSPGMSGGNHSVPMPKPVTDLLSKLLTATPPASYSFAASEVCRRFNRPLDRASVRRWAIKQGLSPAKCDSKSAPVRRWQRQKIGELWQLDATPHRWFPGHEQNFPMLNMLDDCSRLITGTKIYRAETLLAYLDFLPLAFATYGLPLALYVDYHSFFFTHVPDGLTQLGASLKFYDISLRYAPTPQAKGKIERSHLYWQNRLPAFFAAEEIEDFSDANPLIDSLRVHHNEKEKNRELRMTPSTAWNLAQKENRSVLRSLPKCPWWPFIWSQRTAAKVGSDCCISVGTQRLPIDLNPGCKIIRCSHPDGTLTILAHPPNRAQRPQILLRHGSSI